MKRVGILLDSTTCNKYLFHTVCELAQCDKIELFFLLNTGIKAQRRETQNTWALSPTKGLPRKIDLSLFRTVAAAEQIFKSLISRSNDTTKTYSIEGLNKNLVTHLKPVFSDDGTTVSYENNEIDDIRALHLDIIVKGNTWGILKGEILKSAKEGIISLHLGDNRWNRGSLPAFWEVYFQKPSTGFVIQILSEVPNGGPVLFRGNVATCRSYTENLAKLYNESSPYLAKVVLNYAVSGKLPLPEEKIPYGETFLTIPEMTESIKYLFKTVAIFLRLVINRLILRRDDRWGIAFCPGAWREAVLRNGLRIKNLPYRFFADPFVVTRGGSTVCFAEDYSYKTKRGCISAIEIVNNKSYTILGAVIQEPFHMSFPFLFEYKHELYMIPETEESKSIRLYKCVDFPLKWEYQKDILSNCSPKDSMIFEHDNRWWLLTNMATGGNTDHDSQLFAYYSDSPISDKWVAHELNPLVFDSAIGRNAGILDYDSKFPVRVRQKQGFNSYGCSVTLARITDITPSSFNEREIGQVLPNFFPKIRGCHHIHSNGLYTVFDYVRTKTKK